MVLNADCSPDVLEQIKRQGLTFPFSKFCFYFSEVLQNAFLASFLWPDDDQYERTGTVGTEMEESKRTRNS